MGESSGTQVALYLTLLALVNIFMLSPVLFLLDYLKWEVIGWELIPWRNLNGTALLNGESTLFVQIFAHLEPNQCFIKEDQQLLALFP